MIISWSNNSVTMVVPSYNYTKHVDSRIQDSSCKGLPQGGAFSPQVITDLLQASPQLWIPSRDTFTGAPITDSNGILVLHALSASDHYVSMQDLYNTNNIVPKNSMGRKSLNWGSNGSAAAVTQVTSGAVDFSAQLTLAASYGLLQLTYVTAIDKRWKGNMASCGASDPKDPDNLFDTNCNIQSGGGSLGIGTRVTEWSFANKVAGSTSPSVSSESSLETLFSQAYQWYNHGKSGYGVGVITDTKSYEPKPTGKIFTTGGQQ